MIKRSVSGMLLVFFALAQHLSAQQLLPNSAEIQLKLQKLKVVGNVLYIAAHPDDENTRLIAWLANQKKVRTAYLSLTRGDGGQNLIGDEKGPLMGLIRTQELLEARKLDGGEQFFTRAVDFGYSKTAEETLDKWDKEVILSDVVRVIRQYKPDVIITRFPPDKRAGHGHHTTSAILAREAFAAAADSTKFPESAQLYGAWKTERLFFNNSPWWDKSIAKRKNEYVTVNVGEFSPLLGKAYSELASESRSRHKSQGFGALRMRGNRIEYLQQDLGSEAKKDVLENIDISWNRVPNIAPEKKKQITTIIEQLNSNFDPVHPEKSVPQLISLYNELFGHSGNVWVDQKIKETKELIVACGGLWMEFLADAPVYTPGSTIKYTAQVIPQLPFNTEEYSISAIEINGERHALKSGQTGAAVSLKDSAKAPYALTQPYWLERAMQHNMFTIPHKEHIGKPQNDAILYATFILTSKSGEVHIKRPLLYKWRDRVKGELYRPVSVIPPVTASFEEKAYLFTERKSQQVTVKIAAKQDKENIQVKPILPKGWKSEPGQVELINLKKGDLKFISFTITPPKKASSASIGIQMEEGDFKWRKELVEIEYPHIQTQVVLPDAYAQLIRYDIKTAGKKIGYIMGAGDEVPKAIEQLGYSLDIIDIQRTSLEQLKQYDAVIAGIRAFNTKKELVSLQPILMEYVEQGGHFVVQYTTNYGLLTPNIGPYPFKIGRDRVTKEEASAELLKPKHPLFNTPNKITTEDFDNWVQERGLYFATEWDDKYTPLIGWNDPGEDFKKGALLVTNYGSGSFIFTGISFFRQLPAGVPGAYKLFANIISYKPVQSEQ